MLLCLCHVGCLSLAETANRGETEQRQDATKKNNPANLILILRGKSGIIIFEFKTT